MSIKAKAGGMTIGALALTAWIANEGFSSSPVMPREGDRWTIGHGATYYPDTGQPVRKGDPAITREQAGKMALAHLSKTYLPCVKTAIGPETLVSQRELEIAVDFAGNYGCGAYSKSSMPALLRQGQYVKQCEAYLQYHYVSSTSKPTGKGWELSGGKWRYDCSTPGNKVCGGVWTRSKWRYSECIAAQ